MTSQPQQRKPFKRCSNKIPSHEDVTGVTVEGGVMATVTNADKFSNWSWWIGTSPRCKSTVFTRPGFHISVWMYIVLSNVFYFLIYYRGRGLEYGIKDLEVMEAMDSFSLRLLTWLLAGYITQIVMEYYVMVRSTASEMIQGLDSFVDGISISVDYNSPRATTFLNDLYGAVRATAYYALACASENTKFKLSNDKLQAIFDENGYDGKLMTSYPKKQTVTVMRQALLHSLEEEKEASDSCLKQNRYNKFREENIRQSISQFSTGAMSTISCVSGNKLPFAYVHLLTWATRSFLLFHVFMSYVFFALEHIQIGAKPVFSCYNSIFLTDEVDPNCFTAEFVFFNVFNFLAVYFLLGLLELYPVLMKTWQNQLVLENYKVVIDLICLPLKPDACGPPKNLSQLKKTFQPYDKQDRGIGHKYL